MPHPIKYLSDLFTNFAAWLKSYLDFAVNRIVDSLGFLFTFLWEVCFEAIRRFQVFVWDTGAWLFDWTMQIFDWCVMWMIECIAWLFLYFEVQYQVPSGVFEAIVLFFRWAVFFDVFLPCRETVYLLGVLLILHVILSIFRFIRTLIPFLH